MPYATLQEIYLKIIHIIIYFVYVLYKSKITDFVNIIMYIFCL